MRRRSLVGPLLLLLIGGVFLWRNLHPEAPIYDIIATYWPFVLVGWGLLRLVEALFWQRQGYRSGLSGGEVVLIVFLCIAGSGMWQARQHGFRFAGNALNFWAETFEYPIAVKAPAEGMKRLVIETRRGNIKITGADTREVTLTGRKTIRTFSRQDADKTQRGLPVEIIPQGDRLLVRTNQDRGPQNLRVSDDLELTIPRGMAVEARASFSDYEVSDVDGDVQLYSERGDVRLARLGSGARLEIGHSDLIRAGDIKGAVELRGQGSDIDMSNIGGQVTVSGGFRGAVEFRNLASPLVVDGSRSTEMRIQAIPGRVAMDLGNFTASDIVGPARLILRSRDVTVERFTNAIEIETDRGDVHLIPGKLPMPAIEAKSGTGRIDLALPLNAAFRLEAVAETGDAVNEFGPQIRKETLGRRATLSGVVGSNGPNVRLVANRGWISVHKEGSVVRRPDGGPEPPEAPESPEPPSSPDGPGPRRSRRGGAEI